VARRQRLSEIQIAELFEPPTEQRELVRYYTLSEADLAAIARCRGDHNRLGLALMRCYLRYPGRALLLLAVVVPIHGAADKPLMPRSGPCPV
jgi:TnpA family transposase